MKIDFKPATDLINKSKRIGIITHKNSDGDAIGSALALRNSLLLMGKESFIFSNEEIKKEVDFLCLLTNYEYKCEYEDVDLLVILDTSLRKRLTCPSVFNEARENGAKILIVDHHKLSPNDESIDVSVNYPKASSTSEILYFLINELDVEINRIIGECLLVGIETDTSFLNNPNTTETTIQVKKELEKLGVRSDYIIQSIKERNPIFSNDAFLKEIESRTVLNKKSNIVSCYIKIEDQEDFGIDSGTSSIVANYLDSKYEAKIAIVLEQREKETVKFSMRSNKSGLDIAKLASFFGGGAHKQAAGFEYKGKLSDILCK